MAADPVVARVSVDIAVGDCVARVLLAEGVAQLIWHRAGAGPINGAALFNDFLTPAMGDQLRRLADAVDGVVADM